MIPRTISSSQTFLWKYLFPVVWIAGFGFGTISVWLDALHSSPLAKEAGPDKWQFLGFWIAGTALIYWTGGRHKQVKLDDDYLYVSNFIKEIKIPLSNIADVDENFLINGHPVTIQFRTSTEFGEKIVFMPTTRWFAVWSSHPIVAELREAARLHRAHGA